jgi:hypothetical protein
MPGSGDATRVVAGAPRSHLYSAILRLTLTLAEFPMSHKIPCSAQKIPCALCKNSLPVIREIAKKLRDSNVLMGFAVGSTKNFPC